MTARTMASMSVVGMSSPLEEEGSVAGLLGQPAVLPQADLLHPALELGQGTQPEGLPQARCVVVAGALVAEHRVVAHGHTHDEVPAGGGEEDGEVLQVVLGGAGMVGVADVAAHRDAGE